MCFKTHLAINGDVTGECSFAENDYGLSASEPRERKWPT